MTRLSPWTMKLRAWQERAKTCVLTSPKDDVLIEATPAAGKTNLALAVSHALIADRVIDRVMVVCPTNHLREQWARAAGRVGIHLDPALTNEQGQEARDYHGCVVTYQQVCLAPVVYAHACTRRRTLVILDEIHHAGDAKSWGEALRTACASAVKRLGISGTPFRTDNTPIPFVTYIQGQSRPDFTYSYAQALRDGVCRPIVFPSYEGDVRWLSKGVEHAASFREGLSEELRRERLKAALLLEDWLGTVIEEADAQLSALRRDGHPGAAGLIIAMDQEHARQIGRLVARRLGVLPSIAVSDDPRSSETIKDFESEEAGRWLIAVNMVSEGVDIPRLRVGIYASHVQTEMYFRQVVGRFIRWQRDVPRTQRAYLYLPQDPILVQYALAIKAERDHVLTEEAERRRQPRDPRPEREPSELVPLSGVAQASHLIGDDVGPPSTAQEPGDSPVPLYAEKDQLRDEHRRLVGKVASASGIAHRQINATLMERAGGSIEKATVAQLQKRLQILRHWMWKGYDGRR